MADWHVSSVSYAAVPIWVASTAYTVGQFVRATTLPSLLTQRWVFRCTTAGTSGASEPTWSSAPNNNSTIASGGATFTNVSGQSAYGWTAAAGTLLAICSNRPVASSSDRVFLASDHSENSTGSGAVAYDFNNSTAAFGLIRIMSVNRAGSVPPVEADVVSGAAITFTASGGVAFSFNAYCNLFWQGITFTAAGSTSQFYFNSVAAANKSHYVKNCAIVVTSTSASLKVGTLATARATLDNTTMQFGATAQSIGNPNVSTGSLELHWINTPSAIGGSTFPTTLFTNATSSSSQFVCRGVDLSAITGTLMSSPASAQGTKLYLDSCKIHPSVTRYGTPAAGAVANDEVELVNCYDGTNVLNERYGAPGTVTTDRATYMTDGAEDDIGAYSLKLVSSSRADKSTVPLDSFWCDVGNTATGSSKTATVEIVSSASLNNDDISLLLEYMGTASSSVASFTSTLPATPLTTASALPASGATWTNPPGTPVKQYLQATFTPQAAGRIRGLVKLGKTATTCWVNPQITVS